LWLIPGIATNPELLKTLIPLNRLFLFCLLFCFWAASGSAQVADSLRVLPPDSARTDTTRADSLKPKKDPSGLDTLVNYTSATIDFDVQNRVSILTGDAVITYKDMKLEAEKIVVDWDKQILTAEGVPDTIFTDTTRTEIDSIFVKGRPHFTQTNEDFYGEEIAYNMKTKIGRVRGGRTTYEDGFYHGEQFKRLSESTLSANQGDFTTCNKEKPDYHFAAKTLKVKVGKRVIARPVVLYFEDVPVLAAPYGIFPQQHGRTSGILIPTFGESGTQGRFLKDIGYFWATSDYMDLRSSFDYYEKFGIQGRSNFRYTKRYVLDGSTNFDFNAQRTESNGKRRDFHLSSRHNQTIDRNTRLTIAGEYTSNKSYLDNTGTMQQRLNQTIQSNATLGRSWDNWPWTMSANLGYTQNLNTDTWNATLPAVSFTHKSGLLFPGPKAERGVRGSVAPKELEPPWYRVFSWNYGFQYRNELSMPKQPKPEGIRLGMVDIYGRRGTDSTLYGSDSSYVFQHDGLTHSGGISATAKIFRYLNLNPRFNARMLNTRKAVRYVVSGKTLKRADEDGFFQRTTFDLGTSLNTKLYGLMRRPLGVGASFRHVMTPSVSFTYTPDFGERQWGYYKTVTMPDGRKFRYDRFPGTENISGGGDTPTGKSERFGFSLDQLFQMKTDDGSDVPVDESAALGGRNNSAGAGNNSNGKRYDLLSWGMSTGMDPKRDSLKWDNLSMSFRTAIPGKLIGPIQSLAFDVSTNHSLYASNGRGGRIQKFYWERGNAQWYAPLDIVSAAINVGFSIQAESLGSLFYLPGKRRQHEDSDTSAAAIDSAMSPISQLNLTDYSSSSARHGVQEEVPIGDKPSMLFDMPLSMSVSIRQNRDYQSHTVTSGLATRTSLTLTPRWKIDFDYNLDLKRKKVNNASLFLTRDLHCWEATFSWSPYGYDGAQSYFLRINIKSPQLKDIKVERRRGGGYGGLN
jgi:lipopolysaccharide assembly outer membrane protein LptD (OstA)